MSKTITEKDIRDWLTIRINSRHFLSSFKRAIRMHGNLLVLGSGLPEHVISKIAQLDTTCELKAEHRIPSQPGNARQYSIDLYYESPKLRIVFELKKGDAGFRSISQAVCYKASLPSNACDLVVLLAEKEGDDFNFFVTKCIRREALRCVLFLPYTIESEMNGAISSVILKPKHATHSL